MKPIKRKICCEIVAKSRFALSTQSGAYGARTGNAEPRLVLSTVFVHLRVFISRLQQHRFQLSKRAQELIRLDNVAFAVAFVRINNPPSPTMLCDGAAIAPRPTGSVKLVSYNFPVFHWPA